MKNKLLQLTSFLLLAILLIPLTVSAESKPITKEEVFTTTNSNFYFDFEKRIKVNDKNYKLANVSYTELDKTAEKEEKTIKKTKKYLDLYTKSCNPDKQLIIERDGKQVTVNLDKITYEDTTITGRYTTATVYKTTGYTTTKPNIDTEKTINYKDKFSGETVTATLPLKNVQVIGKKFWKADVKIPITFEVYGAEYYLLGNKKIPHNDDNPQIADNLILKELNLSNKTYRITKTEWQGKSFTKNGKTYRKAIAYGERYVAKYKATYQDKIELPDCDGYIGTAHYVGKVNVDDNNNTTYKVKATATYNLVKQQSQNNNIVKYIAIGVGVLLVAGAIVLILFFIAKKRKKRNE